MIEKPISRLDEKLILNILNDKSLTPDQLVQLVKDDPAYGSKSGIGIRHGTALLLLEIRSEYGEQGFTELDQILKVKGIGKDTYHDIIYSIINLPPEQKVLHFFNTVTSYKELTEFVIDDPESGAAFKRGITTRAAKNIIEIRRSFPHNKFPSLKEIDNVKYVGEQTLHNIIYTFTDKVDITDGTVPVEVIPEEKETTPPRAAIRAKLAIYLRNFLSHEDKSKLIIGTDSVETALEKISAYVDSELFKEIERLYELGLEYESIKVNEPVSHIVHFPQVSDTIVLKDPQGILNPNSIPDIAYDYKWFRTDDGIVIEPSEGMTFELLIDGVWSESLRVPEKRIYVSLEEESLALTELLEGLTAKMRGKSFITAKTKAVRFKSRKGIRGCLRGNPYNMDIYDESKVCVPVSWDSPGSEIWINPVPGLPPILKKDYEKYLPTSVVIGGDVTCVGGGKPGEEEEKKPIIFVGSQTFIAVYDFLPWPWGPFPWPPVYPPKKPYIKGKGYWGLPIGLSAPPDLTTLTVKIGGCQCIRLPEIAEFKARPSIEGGSYKWSVSDDDIAEIEGPDDEQNVKLKSKDLGKVDLTVDYTLHGMTVTDSMGVFVIYHKFTLKDAPESEKMALPLVQPTPKARFEKNNNITVRTKEVDIDRHRVKFNLDVKGALKDALIDIEEVEISAAGGFKKKLDKGAAVNGFTDEKFSAKDVEIFGPGRSYMRVRAKNSVERWGTDTIDVISRIPDNWIDNIDRLESTKALFKSTGASESELKGCDDRLKSAWDSALKRVEFEFAYLEHTENTVLKVPGSEKWSIAVEDDAKQGVAFIKTKKEKPAIVVEEKRKLLLAPKEKPKNYFYIDSRYTKERVDYERHGRIKAEAGEKTSLIYIDPCCAHIGPAVGVDLESPGVKRIKKGEAIQLRAKGKPKQFMNVAGIYTWNCIAFPEGANFEFKPDAPGPHETVEFFTDIPGIYTFKVGYQLLDASGPWTYAESDGQIIFKVDAMASICRIGDYSGEELKKHKDRPLYKERTVKEQHGAEIKIHNVDPDASIGKDLEIEVLCPQELEFAGSLCALVHFADDSESEYAIHIDPKFRFRGKLTLRTAKVIDYIFIKNIKYKNLPRMKGDAVWIDAVVRPLVPEIIDLASEGSPGAPPVTPPDAGSTAPDAGNSSVNVVAHGGENRIDLQAPPDFELSNPVVNLLLRTRDLGSATASNAGVTLGTLPNQVNVTNGNQFFALPLFTTKGMGFSLSPTLSYNSKAATFDEAIELYGLINGKDKDKLKKEFGPCRYPKGWNCSFDLGLYELIDVEYDYNRVILKKCVEIRYTDGNKIVFEEVEDGLYHVQSDAECIGDSPNSALGMVLRKIDDKEEPWRLEEADGTWWIFDKDRNLCKKNNPAMRKNNSSLKGMVWEWNAPKLKITDSCKRETNITFDDQGILKEIKAENKALFNMEVSNRLLARVSLPQSIEWSFEYADFSLMQKISPPEGLPLLLYYYLGNAVETVGKDIAENYWGRVYKLGFGDRKFLILYEQREADENSVQKLLCQDPVGFQWKYEYDQVRQALRQLSYMDSESNGFKKTAEFRYDGDTKLVRTKTNISDAHIYYYYSSGRQGKIRNLVSVTEPGNYMRTFEYKDNGFVTQSTDENQEITKYKYTDDNQIEEVEYPQRRVIRRSLNFVNVETKETFLYDDFGRSRESLSSDGVKRVHEYENLKKSNHTGFPKKIQTGTAFEEFKWDRMGNLKEKKNHLGYVIKHDYDELGRLVKTSEGTKEIDFTYDAMGRLTGSKDSAGRTTETRYDAYGEVISIKNIDGNEKEYLEKDDNGNVLKVKHEDGSLSEFRDYDALGRWKRKKTPSVAERGRNGMATEDMPDAVMEYNSNPVAFAPSGEMVTYIRQICGNVIKTTYHNLRGQLVGEETSLDGKRKTTVTKYGPTGKPIEKKLFVDDREVATLEEYGYDAAGNLYWSKSGSVTICKTRSRDKYGLFEVELYPSQSSQIGARPSTTTLLDDNYRKKEVIDGMGKTIAKYDYDDANKISKVSSVNPSSENNDVKHMLTLKYNEYGKLLERRDERTGDSMTLSYDNHGRLASMESPEGKTEYEYDVFDRVIKETRPVPGVGSGQVTFNGTNTNGPAGSDRTIEIETVYDKMGRITSRGSVSAREEFTFDALGRIKEKTVTGVGTGGSYSEKYYFNSYGDMTGKWISEGLYHTFTHDYSRNKTTERLIKNGRSAGTRVIDFDYYGNPKRYAETSSANISFDLRHDGGGRLRDYKLIKNGNTLSQVSYGYGNDIKPNTIDIENATAVRTTSFQYNSNLLVKKVSDSHFNSNDEYEFNYNDASMRTSLTRPANTKAMTIYKYYENACLAEMMHVLGEDWEKTFKTKILESDYDNVGNPKKISHTLHDENEPEDKEEFLQGEEHEYDKVGRLVKSTYNGVNEGWIYDDKTKIERQFYYDEYNRKQSEIIKVTPDTDDDDEQIVEVNNVSYGSGQAVEEEIKTWQLIDETDLNYHRKKYLYDELGRRTHLIETVIRNDLGRKWARMTEYRYTFSPQPVQVIEYEMRGGRKQQINNVTNVYDPFGKMVYSNKQNYGESKFGKESVNTVISGTYAELSDFESADLVPLNFEGEETRFYIYAGQSLVSILDEQGNSLQEFLNGPGINSRLALAARRGGYYDYYLDHRGGAMALTESDGEIAQAFKQFGTYGEYTESRGEAVQGGNWYDFTGFAQAGVRKYDPAIGQFSSPDPSGLAGGVNLYSFAENNPVTKSDVDGESPAAVIAIIGLAIWAGWEAYAHRMSKLHSDPGYESSPSFKLYHAYYGVSAWGTTGTMKRYEGFERAWEGVQGALDIIGFILPLAPWKAFTWGGAMTRFGRVLAVEAGANIIAGSVEMARGNTAGGAMQAVFGSFGFFAHLGLAKYRLRANSAEVIAFLDHTDNLKRSAGASKPVNEMALIRQLTETDCSITSCLMTLRRFGYHIDGDSWQLLANAVNFNVGQMVEAADIFAIYKKLIPNAQLLEFGSLTVDQLAHALKNGHPVHLLGVHGNLPGFNHAIVLSKAILAEDGTLRGFLAFDPDSSFSYFQELDEFFEARYLCYGGAIIT